MTDVDPRAKYRRLPPIIDPEDMVETVDASEDNETPRDPNEGAGPYLRITWGPSVG